MATKTPNYQLILPSPSDYYNISVFNKNTKIIDAALKSLVEAINGTLLEIDVVIPVSAWQRVEPTDTGNPYAYTYYYDISDENITADAEPTVYVDEDSELTAAFAGMCSIAKSFEGYVRLKCVALPESDISIHCSIVGTINPDIDTGDDSETDTGDEDSELPDGYVVATDGEVQKTVDDVLSGEYTESGEEAISPSEEVATDDEVEEKVSDIFGI